MKVKRLDEDIALNIRDRLKEVRQRTGLSMAKFSASLGYSPGNIGDWESGKALPSLSALIAISKEHKISLDWLLAGQEYISQIALDTDQQELIEAYNLLDDNKKHSLKEYAAFLLSKKYILKEALNKTLTLVSVPEPEIVKEEKRAYLPILGRAAAGMPIMAQELLEGFIPVPAAKIKKNSFVIQIRGESMIEAGIQDGDFVIITSQPVVENGEIALVKVDGEVTLKKFYRYDFEVRLKPANSTMRDIVITDLAKIRILGKMIGVIPAEEVKQNMRQEFNGPNE